MKNLFFALALITLTLASCKKDDSTCKTCELSVLILTTTSEVCQDGTGIKVTTTVSGQSTTESIPNTTVEAYTSTLSSGGYSCK